MSLTADEGLRWGSAGGAEEDEPVDAVRVVVGEVSRDGTAERHSAQVELVQCGRWARRSVICETNSAASCVTCGESEYPRPKRSKQRMR